MVPTASRLEDTVRGSGWERRTSNILRCIEQTSTERQTDKENGSKLHCLPSDDVLKSQPVARATTIQPVKQAFTKSRAFVFGSRLLTGQRYV